MDAVPKIPVGISSDLLARRGLAMLIAPARIDGGVPLITQDRGFRAFAAAAGLDLVAGAAG